MTNFEGENWRASYQIALFELEHAKIVGRIDTARTAILDRFERLRSLPGLHSEERQALADALSGLRLIEMEEESRPFVIDRALKTLKIIGPKLSHPPIAS